MKKKERNKILLSPNALRGKLSKSKGIRNENKTIDYVLSHAEMFGNVKDKDHIYFTPRGTSYHKDLFSTAFTLPNGKTVHIGFDLCCLSTDSDDVVVSLIQVKSTRLPPKWYIDVLRKFPVSSKVKKYLFLWKADEDTEPQIILL